MAKIVVVDDDQAFLDGVVRCLEREGYEVRGFTSGEHALAAASGWPADLVISDLNMPDVDGIEVLLGALGGPARVPVIAMTGGGMFSGDLLLRNAHALGAAGVLHKPFELSDLTALVGRTLAANAEGD